MSTAIDVRKYFNTDLPAALSANAEAARAIGARYQLVVLGADGGEWAVDLTAKGPSCKPGKTAADCTITISDTNFRILCEKPDLHALLLFMSGRLKVEGNTAIAMKLSKALAFVSLPKGSATPSKPAAAQAAPKVAVAPAPKPAVPAPAQAPKAAATTNGR